MFKGPLPPTGAKATTLVEIKPGAQGRRLGMARRLERAREPSAQMNRLRRRHAASALRTLTQTAPLPPQAGQLWALRQDFPESGPASIWLNCSVAKLSSGGLLVSTPPPDAPGAGGAGTSFSEMAHQRPQPS
jgi:hypothetical protein